mgnify:CR=1 FL=1
MFPLSRFRLSEAGIVCCNLQQAVYVQAGLEFRLVFPDQTAQLPPGRQALDTEALIQEYFQAAYGADWERVLTYLSELSRLSSCDYLNGKGDRTDPDIARRMREAQDLCRAFSPVPEDARAGGHGWRLLAYHRKYALGLARALELLAGGPSAFFLLISSAISRAMV